MNSDFSFACDKKNVADITTIENQSKNLNDEIIWSNINGLYSFVEHIEDFEVKHNPLFIPYVLCGNNEEEDHNGILSILKIHQEIKNGIDNP